MGNIFYSTPYPLSKPGAKRGNFKQFVPDQSLNPTPLLIVHGNGMQRASTRSLGNALSYRGVHQGLRSVNKHYDYTYGTSKRSLRPTVTDDDAWLMSVDPHYQP